MRAVLISIGTELTSGQTVDTNSAWLAAQLESLGIEVCAHVTVPDDEAAISRAMTDAAAMGECVVVSGGLGPTEDDRTRAALAATLGVELAEDAEALRWIEAFFAQRKMTMREGNRRQALVPRGARAIDNPCGTAPGLRARIGAAEVFVLPGVPFEMRAMFERDVRPVLAAAQRGRVTLCEVVHTCGKPESEVGGLIADLMAAGRNPAVGTTAALGIISVRIRALGETREVARTLLESDVHEVCERLGDAVFGRGHDSLAAVVGGLLRTAGKTLAVAESCTGGLLAKMITDVPGSSAYFLDGAVTYSNRAKKRFLGVPPPLLERHGAVSAEVAQAMALGCRQRSEADYALATTGIAGPDGGTPDKPVGLVYVALAVERGAEVRELRLGEQSPRDVIRERSCIVLLNMLRRKLLAQDDQARQGRTV